MKKKIISYGLRVLSLFGNSGMICSNLLKVLYFCGKPLNDVSSKIH